MRIERMIRRLRVALPLGLAIAAAWVAPGTGQALAPEAPAPAGELLTTPPFDRITLTDKTVLRIEPVSPRPLPPVDPAKARAQPARTKAGKPAPPPEGNV